MIELQDTSFDVFWTPQTLATNATVSARIDLGTNPPHYIEIECEVSPATAAGTVKWAVLNVGAADTTTFSTNNRISGLIGTTNSTAATGEFVLTGCNDTAKNITVLGFNPAGRGRYIFVQLQPPAGTFNSLSVRARKARLPVSPDSASEAGANQRVYV